MVKQTVRSGFIAFAALMLAACSGGQRLELEVKARMDGQPASQAKVMVDGQELGATDGTGIFAKTLHRKPGAEVEVVVVKEQPGYRIKPWKTVFLVKLPKDGAVDKYSFDAELPATRYITLVATEKGTPVADAAIKVNGKEVGKTDAKGEFVYEYKDQPKKGVSVTVSKAGYSAWQKTGALEPGQRLDAALARRAIVSVTALTEQYGHTSGVAGVAVSIDGRPVGKTDDRGLYTYTYDGAPGKKAPLALSLAGHTPAEWKTVVTLEGQVSIQRYFYPTTPKPIRVGIYGFVGNTLGVDLKDIAAQTEGAVSSQLFKHSVFREVPSAELEAEIKRLKLGIDRITTKGWQDTPLRRTVDMIVLGSVAKDDKGFVIEAKFSTSGGQLILSQVTRARDAGAITGAAREIAANVMERFPFEGTVVASENESYHINIGKPYRISRGTELALTAATLGEAGKVTGYRETGRLKVKRVEDTGSLVEVEDLKQGEKIKIGDRVVRRVYHEGEEARARTYFILAAKGGLAPDVAPLSRVNVYLNQDWVGSTGADGRAEVPLRLGKSYELLLYRHGYQQVNEKIKVDKSGDAREFVLSVNTSLFKVESEPSSAAVFVDGDQLGKTPILEGRPIGLGFHTVKLTVGEDYRDWEEVVEFDKKIEDRTGDRKIALSMDYLKLGERAAQKGDIDRAIQAYASADQRHPDYSEAHHRLARIYLDEKSDYEAAIREFESVLSLPQNQQLIYKQFAVAFTNLGHAYYEKGNSLVDQDREAAAQSLAKAIQNLQIAKQNTRFFPTEHYDEALHNTYFYLALSYHKLYLVTRKDALMNNANLAWREYFDFFPKKLEGNPAFEQNREAARKYWTQIKDQSS
ncbi:MAG: PEGA domain-containing protein [Candidatus Rokuibacteriota bacterium]